MKNQHAGADGHSCGRVKSLNPRVANTAVWCVKVMCGMHTCVVDSVCLIQSVNSLGVVLLLNCTKRAVIYMELFLLFV